MLVMLSVRTMYFIFKYSNILYIYIILLCAFYFSCYISFDKWEILLHKTFYFIDIIHSLMEKTN